MIRCDICGEPCGDWHDCAMNLKAKLAKAEAARDKLQAFKDWTHAYLDAQGVPANPGGPHSEQGCRIGDRMDWWRDKLAGSEAARLKAAEAACAAMRKAIRSAIDNAPGGTLKELSGHGFSTVEIKSQNWHELIDSIATDAGKSFLEALEAAKRLRAVIGEWLQSPTRGTHFTSARNAAADFDAKIKEIGL